MQKRTGDPVIMSKLIKKYRCTSNLSKEFGVGRQKLRDAIKKRKVKLMSVQYKQEVEDYVERPDNSTTLPGKRDTKTTGKKVKQKHVLNDYMMNLYGIFKLERPDIKISKTCFFKLRHPHVMLAHIASRRTCLCTRHQNLALKIKSLQNAGLKCSKNPDVLIKEYKTNADLVDAMNALDVTVVKYLKWKRVDDGQKMQYKKEEEHLSKAEFVKHIDSEVEEFREHVNRIHVQYQEMRKLRETLSGEEIVIWMDFAENYGCTSVEKVQSAYWNATAITLHSMVVYSQSGTGTKAQSYVAVSDVMSQNATTVYTILRKCIPTLQNENRNLKTVHYSNGSPTSQYRNKTIFQFNANHEAQFGISRRWSYLESGHGKDPCDGLGASVKRAAYNAVKQGKHLFIVRRNF